MELYIAKKRKWNGTFKYSRSQLGHSKTWLKGERPKIVEVYKIWEWKIDGTNRARLVWITICTNSGLLLVNQAGFLARNVRSVKIINWVGSWVITLPESTRSVLRGWQTQVLWSLYHDFLGKRYGFWYLGMHVHMDRLTTCHRKNAQSSMTRKKSSSVLPRTCSSNGSKILSEVIVRVKTWCVWVIWKQARRWALA